MIGGVLAVAGRLPAGERRPAGRAAAAPTSRARRCRRPTPRRSIFGDRGGQIITLLSLVSLPPLLNAILMIGTRILFAMGRDGLALARRRRRQRRRHARRRDPRHDRGGRRAHRDGHLPAAGGDASFFLAANYCVCCLALFVLRRGARPSAALPAPGAIPGRRPSCWRARRPSWSACSVETAHGPAGGRRSWPQESSAGACWRSDRRHHATRLTARRQSTFRVRGVGTDITARFGPRCGGPRGGRRGADTDRSLGSPAQRRPSRRTQG